MILASNGNGMYRSDGNVGSGDSLTSKWDKISIEEAEIVGPPDVAAVSSYFAALKSDGDNQFGCISQTAYHIFPLADFPPSGEEVGGDASGFKCLVCIDPVQWGEDKLYIKAFHAHSHVDESR
jgi:hypothetical protein